MNALTQTFDSLGYFEKLKDAGVPEPQARAPEPVPAARRLSAPERAATAARGT